ncbi:MAG: hypothetical protein CMK92_05275 [Pseudomonas sp.]|nr:hypothetical protein [Pseudomonas sp.]
MFLNCLIAYLVASLAGVLVAYFEPFRGLKAPFQLKSRFRRRFNAVLYFVMVPGVYVAITPIALIEGYRQSAQDLNGIDAAKRLWKQ